VGWEICQWADPCSGLPRSGGFPPAVLCGFCESAARDSSYVVRKSAARTRPRPPFAPHRSRSPLHRGLSRGKCNVFKQSGRPGRPEKTRMFPTVSTASVLKEGLEPSRGYAHGFKSTAFAASLRVPVLKVGFEPTRPRGQRIKTFQRNLGSDTRCSGSDPLQPLYMVVARNLLYLQSVVLARPL
jgi:hypothetical protein